MINRMSAPGYVIRRARPAQQEAGAGIGGLNLRLRQLRARGKVTLREQDKYAGLSAGHSQMIDACRRPQISAQVVSQLAYVYGTTMDYLFNGEGAPPGDAELEHALDAASGRAAAYAAAKKEYLTK